LDTPTEVRLDKWLWAVRLFKTRTNAAEACRAGHVKINGQNVKPAHSVKSDQVIIAQIGELTRTVKVIGFVQQRIGAKLVSQYLEDLTPASEYEKRHEPGQQPWLARPKGLGRPTKKDRRMLHLLKPL
jgi:ribosome-associated heat shock protein Hsp15